MSISASERDELRALAKAAWGTRGAELLMAGLAGADVDAVEERLTLRIDLARSELRTEVSEFRGEVRGEFGQLRREMGELRGEMGELRGEFGEMKGHLGSEIGAIRGEIGKQKKLFLFSIIACFAGVGSIVFGALQIAT